MNLFRSTIYALNYESEHYNSIFIFYEASGTLDSLPFLMTAISESNWMWSWDIIGHNPLNDASVCTRVISSGQSSAIMASHIFEQLAQVIFERPFSIRLTIFSRIFLKPGLLLS